MDSGKVRDLGALERIATDLQVNNDISALACAQMHPSGELAWLG